MKKTLLALLIAVAAVPANAQSRWLVPGLIGAGVGYMLATPRYYYGPYGYTVPPAPVYYAQPPVIVQQPPVVVQNNQICEEKTVQDANGVLKQGIFCYAK